MLHGFQTYATFHNTSMDQEITMLAQSTPMTLYFAILEFSCPDIVFLSLPRRPLDGLITSSLFLILISTIFAIFTTCTSFLLSYQLIKHIRSCLTTSALREHFHKDLRETLQQFYAILKEIPCRLYLALRGLLYWTSHNLTFNTTHRQLVGFTTISLSNGYNLCQCNIIF
jgi:hypothetical protein